MKESLQSKMVWIILSWQKKSTQKSQLSNSIIQTVKLWYAGLLRWGLVTSTWILDILQNGHRSRQQGGWWFCLNYTRCLSHADPCRPAWLLWCKKYSLSLKENYNTLQPGFYFYSSVVLFTITLYFTKVNVKSKCWLPRMWRHRYK